MTNTTTNTTTKATTKATIKGATSKATSKAKSKAKSKATPKTPKPVPSTATFGKGSQDIVPEVAPKTTREIVEDLNTMILGNINVLPEKLFKLEKKAIETAKAENTMAVNAYIDILLDMERVAMFTHFIDNPLVPETIRIKKDVKTGKFEVVDSQRQLSFSELEKTYQLRNSIAKNEKNEPMPNKAFSLAKDGRYFGLISLFTDNMARAIANDIDAKAPTLTKADAATRLTEVDFKAFTNTALVAQLNAIVTAILPEGTAPKMIACDAKALKQAATRDKLMDFTLNQENAFCNKIFMCVGIRKAGKAYSFQSKANCHKITDKA